MVRFTFKQIILMLFTLIFLAVPSVTALIVDPNPSLSQQLNEGEMVKYQMTITGIPQQTSFIILETDLEPFNNTPMWNIPDPEKFGIGNNSPVLMQKKIQISAPGDLNTPIIIEFSGRTPSIKQVIPYNGVVICKLEVSGKRYFSVQPYDSKGYAVGSGDTKVFSVKPASDCIPPNIDDVKDSQLKPIIQDLTNKGLWGEANQLVNYFKGKPPMVELFVSIVSIIVIGVIMLIVGIRIGVARMKKIGDPEKDPEMPEVK